MQYNSLFLKGTFYPWINIRFFFLFGIYEHVNCNPNTLKLISFASSSPASSLGLIHITYTTTTLAMIDRNFTICPYLFQLHIILCSSRLVFLKLHSYWLNPTSALLSFTNKIPDFFQFDFPESPSNICTILLLHADALFWAKGNLVVMVKKKKNHHII